MPRFFCVGSGFGKQFHIKGDKIQSSKQFFFSSLDQRQSKEEVVSNYMPCFAPFFFLANLNRIICRSVFDQKQPRKGPHRAPDKRQRALYWGGIIRSDFTLDCHIRMYTQHHHQLHTCGMYQMYEVYTIITNDGDQLFVFPVLRLYGWLKEIIIIFQSKNIDWIFWGVIRNIHYLNYNLMYIQEKNPRY